MSTSAVPCIINRTSGFSMPWRVVFNTCIPRSAVGAAPRAFATASWAVGDRAIKAQNPIALFLFRAYARRVFPRPRPEHAPITDSAGRCAGRRSLSSTSATAAHKRITFTTTEAANRRNCDPRCVAFVTGSNRGIGLEVTRQLLERTKGTVVATCREPSSAQDLHKLKATKGNENRLEVVRMDVEDQVSMDSAVEYTKRKHGRVDLLFNVAGVLGDGKSTPGPERSLRAMNREWLRRSLEVNTIGPLMLVAALTPLLESPAKKGDGAARPPSVVVNFSARVGSIGDNGTGGWYSYRMSKSALNMATKGISLELRRRRVWAFSYHPGTTDTGLSQPFQANVKPEKLFTPGYTVSQMLGIVDSMTEELSGGFFAFDGSRIVW